MNLEKQRHLEGFSRTRVMQFLGLPRQTLREEALVTIKSRLVSARRNADEELSRLLSAVKSWVRRNVPGRCDCGAVIKGALRCKVCATTLGVLVAFSFSLSAFSQVRFSPVPPPSPIQATLRAALASLPVVPRPTNQGWSIPLAWTLPDDANIHGVRIYASSNQIVWRKVAELGRVTACTLSNIYLPQHFIARSFTTNRLDLVESADSNTLDVIGRETVITVTAMTTTNLLQWETLARIYQRTNAPEAARWFRNDIRAIQQFTTQ